MIDRDSLKKVIQNINTGATVPAIQLVKSSPEKAALISKMVKSRDPTSFDINRPASFHNLNQNQILAISEGIKTRVKDNENIIQLFPDIELAIQILVSSILSPKDMVQTEIIYKTKENIVPPELSSKLNEIIGSHMENHYEFKDELSVILRETLFDSGSYIKTILPESIVDEIINYNSNISTENLSELFTPDNKEVTLGILGNPERSSKPKLNSALERFGSGSAVSYNSKLCMEDNSGKMQPVTQLESLLDISDNYRLLKLPKVVEATNKSKLKNIIRSNTRFATEAQKITANQLSGMLYKDSPNDNQTFMVLSSPSNAKRKSIGRPLVLKLPSESVIPIYIPGNESKHVGYFVLTDIDGNPVTANSSTIDNADGLSGIMANQGHNQSLSTMLINKAKRNLMSNENDVPSIDHIAKVYASIVERDLVNRLKNGIYGNNVAISNNEEVYRIMLSRALASKYTRLIYVPGELVTYFAFKYFDNGVGKSYLDDLKVLSSLRAIMLFSKVMGMTKNAIATTHVNMTIDPNDPDPVKTIEEASHEIVKMRQQYFPLGINSPSDLVDWIQRAGLEFSFEGHPGLPQTKFDFETKTLQYNLPDEGLDEMLRKWTYMAFGLTPEIVDNGFNAEFATTVVNNNILLSKRVFQLQDVLTKHMSDYCRKVVINDSVIIEELLAILKENEGLIEQMLDSDEKTSYAENKDGFLLDLLERYLDIIELDLPKPDITSIETQTAAFDQYVEALDKTLTYWIDSEFITSDLFGEINANIESIKAVVKAYFVRKWMSDNGYMPELNNIVTSDDGDKPNLDIYEINKNHLEGLIRSATKFIESMQPIRKAADADLTAMNIESPETTSNDDSVTENEFAGDFGSDGGMDLGLDAGSTDDTGSLDAGGF